MSFHSLYSIENYQSCQRKQDHVEWFTWYSKTGINLMSRNVAIGTYPHTSIDDKEYKR